METLLNLAGRNGLVPGYGRVRVKKASLNPLWLDCRLHQNLHRYQSADRQQDLLKILIVSAGSFYLMYENIVKAFSHLI